MTHPEELLAGSVDGSLTDPDRTTVDAHLRTCARCRAEVEAAGTAREALRRLSDPEAPDLSTPVIAEIERARTTVPATPRWYRYAGVAAVAVIALVVVVSLPKIGSGPSADRAAPGTSEAAPTVGAATLAGLTLELQTTDYDTAAVQALAGEAARVAPRPSQPVAAAPQARRSAQPHKRNERRPVSGRRSPTSLAPPRGCSRRGSRARPRTWPSSSKARRRGSRPIPPASGWPTTPRASR